MSDISLKIIEVLLPAVLALIAAGLAYGTAYLRARAEAIRNEQAQAMVLRTLTRAHIEVRDAVQATAQEFVNDLKARRENAKLTEEDVRQARERAWTHFKAQMGQAALAELEAIVGDLTAWFAAEVEAAVANLKA